MGHLSFIPLNSSWKDLSVCTWTRHMIWESIVFSIASDFIFHLNISRHPLTLHVTGWQTEHKRDYKCHLWTRCLVQISQIFLRLEYCAKLLSPSIFHYVIPVKWGARAAKRAKINRSENRASLVQKYYFI